MSRYILLSVLLSLGPACELIVGFDPTPELGAQCTDGVDNDGDLLTDCEDDGCADVPDCQRRAPEAIEDSFEGAEDTPLSLDAAALLKNDSDPNGEPLTVTAVSNPEQGTVVLEGATITFTPDPDVNGQASFVYTITDSDGETDDGAVTLNIAPVNDPPVADAQAVVTEEDLSVSVTLTASDIDGDTLSFSVRATPTNGTLSGTAPDLTYTPNADFLGADSFTFLVNDGTADSNLATVSIDVSPINDLPVAADDAFVTDEDTDLALDAPILLGNDIDPDGDALLVVSVENAQNGSVSLIDGVIIFTPDPNFFGDAGFDYTITDGQEIATAFVSVVVSSVNDLPVALDNNFSTEEDTQLIIEVAELLANDSDIDGDTLSLTSVQNVQNGTAELAGGQILFTPNADFNGAAFFEYTVSDGNGEVVVVNLIDVSPINDLPIAVDDLSTTEEDTPAILDTATLLINDLDVDGDTLTVTSVQNEQNGIVSLSGTQITFIPDPDFSGDATFEYTMDDGNGGSATGIVTVLVGVVNDPPLAADDTASTEEDVALVLAGIDLVANDFDTDGDTLTVVDVFAAQNGAVLLNGAQITFTPDADFNGTASFEYTSSDGLGGFDSALVTITVNAVNDAPEALDDGFITNEETQLLIGAVELLANDSDVDGDPLTLISVENAVLGTVSLQESVVTFTPNANFFGTAGFEYTISDGNGGIASAAAIITVNPVNDPPEAFDQSVSTNEDVALNITLSAIDVDIDALVFSVVTDPANGALSGTAPNLTYTPNANFNGADSFTFLVNDGTVDSNLATVSITVNAVNDAPVADAQTVTTDEDTTIGVTLTGTDVDGDPLTFTLNGFPQNGFLNGAPPNVTYTPDPDFNGTDSFGFQVSDGQATSSVATVTVNVTPVNDPPVAADDTATAEQDIPVDIPAAVLLANDTDIDSTLTVTSVQGASGGTAVLNGDIVTFTSAPGFSGAASFTYTASDGALTDDGLVTVAVSPAICGNGILQTTEQCDDGNAVDGDGCDSNCTPTACGNAVLTAGEECDDGNTTSGDGCDAICAIEFCGDSLVNNTQDLGGVQSLTFEWLATDCAGVGPVNIQFLINGALALDIEGDNGSCICTPGIRSAIVTDPAVLALVQNGNNDFSVQFVDGTGNAILAWALVTAQAGTAQEIVIFDVNGGGDAEARNPDLCASGNLAEINATITAAVTTALVEECDDGNITPGDGCDAACFIEFCGDGVVNNNGTEECDDGNNDPGDGCDPVCVREPVCGDAILDPGEVCDDGNTSPDDGCRADCEGFEVCGDGILDTVPGEECDDGNVTNGDGCDAACILENPFVTAAPQIVSGGLACNTNFSNTGRKITTDALGTFYVVMNCGGEAFVAVSDDRSVTYSAPIPLGIIGVSEIAIEGGPANTAYAAATTGAGELVFTRSIDGGLTWAAPTVLGSAVEAEVSIDSNGDSVFIAVSLGGSLRVFRNNTRGAGAFAFVDMVQSNAFHEMIVDKATGDVFMASDDPLLHIRRSTNGAVSFGDQFDPPGNDFFSDWAGSNGFLYIVGTDLGDGATDIDVVPVSDLSSGFAVDGLPLITTSQARAIDADGLGNAYVISQLDSGAIQLDRMLFGASSILSTDARQISSTGTFPGVAAIPSNNGAVIVFTQGTAVLVAVQVY